MDSLSLSALALSFKLSVATTLCLLAIGIPLGLWLATSKNRFKFVIEALIALPLVLPPTVLGFYLLILLNPQSLVGRLFVSITGENILFSFTALLIGSIAYSLPYVVQPLANTFSALDQRVIETAKTFGSGKYDRFFHVVLPMSKSGIITASVLGFAHTLGEFGVVLMLGGNIPGKTQVVSIAIYDHVENINYQAAHTLAAVLLVLSFAMLAVLFKLNHKGNSWVRL